MKRYNMDRGGLAAELAALPLLDRDKLLERWHTLYRRDPPFKISRELLIEALAYRMQEQVLGGLNSSTRRYLLTVANSLKGSSVVIPSLKSGTRLLRDWNGKTHEVTILDNGVMYKGNSYRSLSEVARLITGTRWSGPAFFGLKKEHK